MSYPLAYKKNNTFFLVYVYAELELDIFNGSLQTKKEEKH